ncbi:hypothetical protein L1049_000145 [Liquidambar formosana]|uniref:Uncharacterized protein n=1 Tax=Liquidambar formosana TaxID=63359 RepID=A0AAP0R7H7_LIQFO
MEKTGDQNQGGEEEDDYDGSNCSSDKKRDTSRLKMKELGLSCMLNTEVGAVLAVIRRGPSPELNSQFIPSPEEHYDSSILQSLKSLRALIFNPQQEWRTIDPSVYLSPFLDVIQSDDVPASATGVALSAVLKILKLEIFDEKTPGARDAINSVRIREIKKDLIFENCFRKRVFRKEQEA